MNTIDKLKLNVLYPEIINLVSDDITLNQIVSNKNFSEQYLLLIQLLLLMI